MYLFTIDLLFEFVWFGCGLAELFWVFYFDWLTLYLLLVVDLLGCWLCLLFYW